MGLFDSLLTQVLGNGESNALVAGLVAKVGLTPEQAEMALNALAQAHPQPGNTVETAAIGTGISGDILQAVVGHLGGESGLAGLAASLVGGSGEMTAQRS